MSQANSRIYVSNAPVWVQQPPFQLRQLASRRSVRDIRPLRPDDGAEWASVPELRGNDRWRQWLRTWPQPQPQSQSQSQPQGELKIGFVNVRPITSGHRAQASAPLLMVIGIPQGLLSPQLQSQPHSPPSASSTPSPTSDDPATSSSSSSSAAACTAPESNGVGGCLFSPPSSSPSLSFTSGGVTWCLPCTLAGTCPRHSRQDVDITEESQHCPAQVVPPVGLNGGSKASSSCFSGFPASPSGGCGAILQQQPLQFLLDNSSLHDNSPQSSPESNRCPTLPGFSSPTRPGSSCCSATAETAKIYSPSSPVYRPEGYCERLEQLAPIQGYPERREQCPVGTEDQVLDIVTRKRGRDFPLPTMENSYQRLPFPLNISRLYQELLQATVTGCLKWFKAHRLRLLESFHTYTDGLGKYRRIGNNGPVKEPARYHMLLCVESEDPMNTNLFLLARLIYNFNGYIKHLNHTSDFLIRVLVKRHSEEGGKQLPPHYYVLNGSSQSSVWGNILANDYDCACVIHDNRDRFANQLSEEFTSLWKRIDSLRQQPQQNTQPQNTQQPITASVEELRIFVSFWAELSDPQKQQLHDDYSHGILGGLVPEA
ncbi:hypothetical protein Pelo_10033 [Pelomyxa schiedti]|nr:hypothetical protein Pelo_10033 [Pelomyxa schiedti]